MAVPYHRFDVKSWNVIAMRDKVGKPRINIYGPTFNFHPGAEGDRPAEPWSEMPMGIFTEFLGAPVSNYKFGFRVSLQQDEWITNVIDEWAIDTLTATSAEWSGSKGGLKRDQIQKDYQPTIRRKDGFDPLVSMNYSSKGMEKFHTVIHYLDAKEDGTWSSEPRRPVTGDAGLLDLMGEHKFRKAKVRVEARLAGFQWQGKHIYARWELSKVFVKPPTYTYDAFLNDATIFVTDPGAWIPFDRFLREYVLNRLKRCWSIPQPKEDALTSALAKLQARVVEDLRPDWANPGDPVHGTWILGLRGAKEFSPRSYMDQLEMTVVAPRWFEWKERCGWVESCAVDNLHDGLSRIAIPHMPSMNALVEIKGEDAANLLFSLHLSEQHEMHMLKDALGIHLIGYCGILLRTHPALLKDYIDDKKCKGSGDRFHALIETGFVAREITKGGLSFLKRHSDQYPGCDDDEKLLWDVLRGDLLWCPLLILPALSPRLRCREDVVGAIFERAAEVNPKLAGCNAETWVMQRSVLDAWKSVPPEAVANWTTEGGSPRILAADPRLCMLIPGGLDPQKAAVALSAFCTEKWKDKLPIALHVAWGMMALSRMGVRIFGTHTWEYMTHAERQGVLNGMSSIQDAVDFARTLYGEAPYADIMLTQNDYFGEDGTDHYAPTCCSEVWKMLWRANVVRKELEAEHPAAESLEILWTLLMKTFDSHLDRHLGHLSSIIQSQPRLLGMQFCIQDITDEVVLSIAQNDVGHLKRLLPLPAAATSSEPWRQRRRGSRAAILAEEVLLVVGAGGWDALPQWLQEASDWQHLTCCICLTLPVLSLPTADVRRCQNGHLVCSGCHETYLQHKGFTMRLGACPLCRQQGAWFVDDFATARLRGIALLPGLPCRDQPGV